MVRLISELCWVVVLIYAWGSSLLGGASTTMDVLVAFRQAITADPNGALSSWATNINQTSASSNYCSWEGVVCDTGTPQQVTSIQLASSQLQGSITPMLGPYLDLSSNRLNGTIPAELGECTTMVYLDLQGNQLSGSVPPELANLTQLQLLSLGDNELIRPVPPELANLTQLQVLALGGNRLTGKLPALALPVLLELNLSNNFLQGELTNQLAACAALQYLAFSQSGFQGSIPASLGNLSQLGHLDLGSNHFTSSTGLPSSLANCTKLQFLSVYSNNLSGSIPYSWFQNLRRLTFLSMGGNFCNGTVPTNIASLSKLNYIELWGNHFQGQILHQLLNCTNLATIDLYYNYFTERLPEAIGSSLPNLTVLGLLGNKFYGSIPVSLGNSSKLETLVMGINYGISGTIPKELFGLSKLSYMDLQFNALIGNLPVDNIGINGSALLLILLLNNNNLTGKLPPQLGLLNNLQQLTLQYNQFSGSIPNELGNITSLLNLILDNNQLSGPIPPSLSNCSLLNIVSLNNNFLQGGFLPVILSSMITFDLSNNLLSGPIPPQLGSMTLVQTIDLSSNTLSGPLPASLTSCANLFYLNLSSNNLSGSIPSQLRVSGLQSLVVLNLSRNSISGPIPQELGSLSFLQELDLSFNYLSGEIPDSLTNLSALSFLNVSYNNLEGAIPNTGHFLSFTLSSFLGNPRLCGQLLHIACPAALAGNYSSKKTTILIIVAVSVLIILLLNLSFLYFFSKRRILYSTDLTRPSAFLRLTLEEIQVATKDFNSANILGVGGSAVVYKGITRDGKTLAFKKFLLSRSSPVSPFFAEIRSLGHVRHRNLIKVLGYFSDLDNDILILDYMPNGDLADRLHARHNSTHVVEGSDHASSDGANHAAVLSWPNRLRIAKGIAAGLAYLHHDCPTPIIHLDVKPNNILLDEDLDARITDFGLARVMLHSTHEGVAKSLGYVAPEYASSGCISRKCDVYSYGILLMEIITERSPTDDMFTEGRTLAKWVQSCMLNGDGKFQDHLVELSMGTNQYSASQREQVNILLNLAMLCTKEDPKERPTMQKVVEMLGQKQLAIDIGLIDISQILI